MCLRMHSKKKLEKGTAKWIRHILISVRLAPSKESWTTVEFTASPSSNMRACAVSTRSDHDSSSSQIFVQRCCIFRAVPSWGTSPLVTRQIGHGHIAWSSIHTRRTLLNCQSSTKEKAFTIQDNLLNMWKTGGRQGIVYHQHTGWQYHEHKHAGNQHSSEEGPKSPAWVHIWGVWPSLQLEVHQRKLCTPEELSWAAYIKHSQASVASETHRKGTYMRQICQMICHKTSYLAMNVFWEISNELKDRPQWCCPKLC